VIAAAATANADWTTLASDDLEVGINEHGVIVSVAETGHLRIRPLEDSDTVEAGLETAYGVNVEIVARNVDDSYRRSKFTTSAHGYNNQNEYTLHFVLPADPAPGDPDEDVRFDVVADFPTLPEDGLHRVDRHVNPALGDVDLADLPGREIHVFRSGLVRIDGVDHPPTGQSPTMWTSGGGLVMPRRLSAMPGLLKADEDTRVGTELDTTDADGPLLVCGYVLDGVIGPSVSCDEPASVLLWDGTTPGEPVLVDEGVIDLETSPRNRRTHVPVGVVLQPDRTYRLVARVQQYRASPLVTPATPDGLRVTGGLRYVDTDPCSGAAVETAPASLQSQYLAVRYGPAETIGGPDLDGDGMVGTTDLLIMLAAWGDCAPPPADCPADLDGSGTVDTVDLLALLAAWG